MKTKDDVVRDLTTILETLLAKTKASRTTIRLDVPAYGFEVADVVAEARLPGEKSLKGQTSINQRAAGTVKWMEKERRLLVQSDLVNDKEIQAPPALIQGYGTKAQMLAPLFRKDFLLGWISVHENKGTRQWQRDEIAALEAAQQAAHRELDAIGV